MISEVFIKRPITAIVISVLIVMIGIIAISVLPISQYPDISPPSVTVAGNYTGADAQTVEQTVTTPVELQINGTPGMTYMSSNSTSDGLMSTSVTFDLGTNVDVAALDVQNRVGVAEPALPDAVKRLGITVKKKSPSLLMGIVVYSPKGTKDKKFIDNYTNIYLKDAVSRVKGVGDIRSIGQDYSMRIWLNPEKMANLSITPAEVNAAIQDQNLQVAGGLVGGSPQYNTQAFEYPILINGRLKDESEFEDIIIKSNPTTGGITYLKDIARIELGAFTYGNRVKWNGHDANLLLISQSPGSNALATADGIYKTLAQVSKTFPKDVHYEIGIESTSVVQVSIEEVIHTLVEALILVTLVVFLFLQSWRATLVPILAIPVSIIGTFIFFIPFGFTINTLTLFGFVLAIGIVVDDAIVVVEAVQHYIDHGKLSAKEATMKAMKDITAPVIAIALILAAVFVPVGFIPGIVGRLYQQFAITIAISVMISAFVALSLTPALCALLLKPTNFDKESKGLNQLFYRFNVWFHRVTEKYSSGVKKTIKAAPMAMIILICIYVGTGLLFKSKPTGFIPTEDEGRLFMTVTLPEGAAINRTQAVLDSIQHIIDKDFPQINSATCIAGFNFISGASKGNSGTFFIRCKPWSQRTAKEDNLFAIMARLNARVQKFKNASIRVITPGAIPGLGNSGGFSFILEQRQNGSVQAFDKALKNFVKEANQRPEIGMAYTFFTANTPSYQIHVDKEKAKKMGVPLSSIYSTIASFMGSSYVNDFTKFGRNYRVVTQADTAFRNRIDNVNGFYVKNTLGQPIPLSTFISHSVVENAALISHFNLFRSAEVSGSAANGYSSGQVIQALEEIAAKTLPDGYGYDFSGLSLEEVNAGNSTTIVFSLCIIFVFLLLAALYESWSVPFSILLAIPIGAFGAIVTLSLFPSLTNNVYAQIGLVTLIGLSAKNAILIVEFAKERLDWGMGLLPSTIEAVKLRLRPIIMTSFAFLLGVLPLAFASGAGSIARQTIGWTVIGGMIAATFITIFMVPVLFVLISRMAYGKKKLAELEANYQPEAHEDTLHAD